MGLDDKIKEAKGRVEEAAGDITDDKSTEARGKMDQASGKLGDKIDLTKDRIADATDDEEEDARR